MAPNIRIMSTPTIIKNRLKLKLTIFRDSFPFPMIAPHYTKCSGHGYGQVVGNNISVKIR